MKKTPQMGPAKNGRSSTVLLVLVLILIILFLIARLRFRGHPPVKLRSAASSLSSRPD
jgi:hypothetical protein